VLGLLDHQRRDLAAVVHNTAEVLDAFGDRTAAVRTLARQAHLAADAAASRDHNLSAALALLPTTAVRARGTVARLAAFSARSTPVFADLTDVTRRLTPLLRDLGPTAHATTSVFRRLPGALATLRPLLRELEPLSAQLRPAVRAAGGFLGELNPFLRFVSPYARDIAAFFPNAGDALGSVDASGNEARVFPIVSASTYSGLPDQAKQALDALYKVGSVGISTGEHTNAYPKPGTGGSPRADVAYEQLSAEPPLKQARR
jgi:phospholipid/cholesterol/gamma-HCH transport system substrate-binding protein